MPVNKNKLDFQNDTSWKDFNIAATLGLVPGVEVEVKFGHVPNAPAATITDVWEGGAATPEYIYPDNAGESLTIVSSDGSDVQPVSVKGLDIDGNKQIKEVVLDGLTPVAVPGIWTATNRADNATITETKLLGNVTIKGSVSANTFAIISPDDQQTSQCIYKVPLGVFALINNYSTAINEGGNQDAISTMRFSAMIKNNVFKTQIRYGLQKSGTSNISSDLIVPPVLPPLTKLKVSCEPDSGPMDVSAEFSMLLIDEEFLPELQKLFPTIFGG